MEYTMRELAKMSGVSTRTLRYYDEIGLLRPARVATSGYRFYGQEQIDVLQQILFYKELDFSLESIGRLLDASSFDRAQAFEDHLLALRNKRKRMDRLIANIAQSLSAMKGEVIMTDQEKFEGFKQSLIDDNERKYGKEIRKKYGDDTIDEANATLMGLTQAQYNESERLRVATEEALAIAFKNGDPSGADAQHACDLHRQWLTMFYPKYNKAYHRGLGEMYVADERFRVNYDKIASGCTEFFRDAINIYCT